MGAEKLFEAADEVRVAELERRHIDRNDQLAAGLASQARLFHRLLHHPVAETKDLPAALGNRYEFGR